MARGTGATAGQPRTGPTAGTAAETVVVLDDHGPFGVLDAAGDGRGRTDRPGAFRLKALNRCVLARRRVEGAHPDDRLPDGAFGTELRFPLDAMEPAGAALCLMTSDRRFVEVLTEMAGAEGGRDREALAADADLLALLDGAPAFDPYLVRRRLDRAGLDPAGTFTAPSAETVAATHALQRDHLRPAIRAALAVRRDGRTEDPPDRDIDRTWATDGIGTLARLVERLGVPAGDVPAALDGWEALACFALRRAQARPLWDGLRAWLIQGLRAAPIGADWPDRQQREPFERALLAFDTTAGAVDTILADYATAYRDTILDRSAARPLAIVLQDAPVTARRAGGLMAAMARAVGCWRRHGDTIAGGGPVIGPPPRVADQIARALMR
jgi:hypothetical protein